MRTAICGLAALLALPVAAAEAPACLPQGAVAAHPESPLDGWLVKSAADDVKRHLAKVVGGGQWENGTLHISCTIQGGTPLKSGVVTVHTDGEGVPEAGNAQSLAALAARTGHSRQEADVLARKYAQLSKAFFRQLRDADGSQRSEREIILRKHERRAGGDPDGGDDEGADAEMDERSAAALEAKIEAAEARGDLAEVMRLAGEARKDAVPVQKRAEAKGKEVEKRHWDVLQRAHPELAEASYRTAIVFGHSPCTPCALPQ